VAASATLIEIKAASVGGGLAPPPAQRGTDSAVFAIASFRVAEHGRTKRGRLHDTTAALPQTPPGVRPVRPAARSAGPAAGNVMNPTICDRFRS